MLFSQWLRRFSNSCKRRSAGRRCKANVTPVTCWNASPKREVACDIGTSIERFEDRSLLVSGTFAFTVASSSAVESTTTRTVNVTLTTDAALGSGDSMSIDVNLGAGTTATGGGVDFSYTNTTLTFTDSDVTGAGTFTKSVTVTVVDDRLLEVSETVELELANPVASNVSDSAVEGAINVRNVIITDNESATLAIATTSSATEAGGAQTVGVVTLTITGTGSVGTFALDSGISITADVTQSGGTATSGSDYSAFGTQTVTFSGGAATGATQGATLTVTEDVLLEGSETVGLLLGNLGGSAVSKSLGSTSNTTTISDNESATLAIATTSSVTEAGGAQTVGIVTLTITGTGSGTFALGSGISITADVTQSGGTATSGSDYSVFGTQTVTFSGGAATGDTQGTTLTVTEDVLLEGSETVGLLLGNLGGSAVSKSLGNTSNTTTISDNESATLDIAATSSVTENGGSQTVGVVTLTITGTGSGTFALGSGISITADVTQSGGTATSGTDYTAFGTQTVTFNGGAATGATRNTTLVVTNDRFLEAAETVGLTLGNLGGSSVSKSLGNTANTTTITDNESATLVIATTSSVTESGGAQSVGIVTLTITGSGTGTFSIGTGITLTADVTQVGGSATSGADYSPFGTQAVTFAAGTLTGATRTTTLTVTEDVLLEGSETVGLTLGNLSAAGTATSFGNTANTTTISDNESATLAIATTSSATEAGGAQTVGVVTLTITGTGSGTFALGNGISITADVTQTGGTATSGSDYSAFGTQTVTFSGGASTGATQSTTLTVLEDQLLEGSQTVGLTLGNLGGSAVSKSLGNTSNTTTITDNEIGVVNFQADQMNPESVDPTVKAILTITPTGSGTIGLETAFSVTATDAGTGTATAADLSTAFGSQTLNFSPATGSLTIDSSLRTIDVNDDRRLEGNQTVDLTIAGTLSSTLNGLVSIGDSTHTATIVDNETGVINFQADQSNDESVDPTIRAILTITPIGSGTVALEQSLTVVATDLLTGTATSGTDYAVFAAATLTISAVNANGSNQINSSTATLDVTNDRRTKEGNETVNFSLGSLSSTLNGTTSLGDTTHTATIQDNDFITVAGLANANEGDEYCLNVTLNLNPAPDISTSYTINWGDGSSNTYGPGGLSNGTVERQHIYDDDFGPGLSTTYNVTVDTTESLGSYTDQANPSPHSVTVHNVNPRDGASFGPVTYTGEDLLLSCNSTASFPSGTQSLTGTRLNLTNTLTEGVLMRMPLVAAGRATNASSVTFTITADWDALSGDNDFGIVISDGTTAVGSNLGDNGGGFLWGEQGTDSGNRLTNVFYPSPGALARTMPFTLKLTVTPTSTSLQGTNGLGATLNWTSTKRLNLSNQLVLLLTGDNVGESYGLKTLTVQVAAVGTDLTNNGPVNEGSTATVSFTNPFDPSNADSTAGFHYAFDMDNDGAFDDGFGDGTYDGSSNTTGTATVPASVLDDGGSTRTVRGRMIDKDGGFTDYTTTITINNVNPTATLSNAGAVTEGSAGLVSFSGQIDPSMADTVFGFHYAYDFDNDGTFDSGNGTFAGSLDTTGAATVPASYLNDGPSVRVVRARIIDKNDGYTDYTTAITVNNSAPVFDAGVNETLAPSANGAFSRTGILITDASPVDTFTGFVSYGDGVNNYSQQITINQVARTFSLSHTYATSGTYLVTVTIADDDGGTLTDTFTVTATVATAHLPEVSANQSQVTINEGQTAANTGLWADSMGHGVTLSASVGTIIQNGGGTWSWSYATTDNSQSTNVVITATDSTGAVNSTTFGLTVNNVAPTAGGGVAPFTLGPTSYTGAQLHAQVGLGNASYPSGTNSVTGSRLNLTGNQTEGIVYRLKLVNAGMIANSQTAVFLVTVNWDALTSDNDFGITISDGINAVGMNLGDNGGGFLWGEQGSVSGTRLTGVSYPSVGSLGRVMPFTVQVTVAPSGITVKGTNGIGVSMSYPASKTLNLTRQIDLILANDNSGESYGVNSLTTKVTVTGGGGLSNSGPVPAGGSATVSFVSPTDVSSTDLSAGLRFAYDFNNDGSFDLGDGTYGGSVTSSSVSVPASFLSTPGTRTIRARIIDKDGGFMDFFTDLVVT